MKQPDVYISVPKTFMCAWYGYMCIPCLKHIDETTTENYEVVTVFLFFLSIFILTFPFAPFTPPPLPVGKRTCFCVH